MRGFSILQAIMFFVFFIAMLGVISYLPIGDAGKGLSIMGSFVLVMLFLASAAGVR